MDALWSFLSEHPVLSSFLAFFAFVACVAIYDIFIQKKHIILHNFPVVGHLRYWLETIGPELRQYWVADDKDEAPFNRQERRWIYASAKGENSTFGFGTTENLYTEGFPIIKHAAFPFPETEAKYSIEDKTYIPCHKVMGHRHNRKRPFHPQSVINISAMSFGSLGSRSVSAMNQGAQIANCYHNTGEGGLCDYHKFGADLMWQLGTGYFGARSPDGGFDLDTLARKCDEHEHIRCIEIKLSQGAKPGKGGILPGAKVTAEIARTRGIPVGQDCMSPNAHREFNDVDELIDFIERVANRTGLPVGIKSAIGALAFWEQLAKRMKTRGEGPDFVSVDGGEGGTGAAPLTYSDHVSLPFRVGFKRVYPIFQAEGLSKDVVWIGSGKLGFPDRAIVAFAMGCDMIQVAREAMLSIGCIQAQKCHSGHCPAGIATQNWWLQAGVNVEDKAQRMARYMQSFRKELLSLCYACGYQHPCQFTGKEIEFCVGVNEYARLDKVLGYERDSTGLMETRSTVTA